MNGKEGTSGSPGHPEVTTAGRGDLFDADCPTRLLLDRVGSKWTVMIVLLLADDQELRFGALRRRMPGVSQKMLTHTLRQLEDDGLAHRRVEPTSPPAVHYSLTALGDTLVGPLRELKRWAETNMGTIDALHTSAVKSRRDQ
ncbi:transcriptional regulator [Micromonospora wenchangensis]|uniref:Transcriptional regulator n=1 Tax=Micromonospora wenchangensis TaxID=1185415 RepID=A0A246RRF7_9ACTN|nr:transcriptional regulator [Micromonospora wenchangensis]